LEECGGEEVVMSHEQLPDDMPPELAGKLFDMLDQHFGVTLRRVRDPETGLEYVDMAQICDVLGLDASDEFAKMLTDPVLGAHVAIVEPPRCETCRGAGRVPTADGEHWLPCPDCQGKGSH
jgi:hypothetical protein